MVVADSGQIGGNASEEYMVLADAGEAEIASCTCGYAADTEAAQATPHPVAYAADALTKLETPGVHTIEELADKLGFEGESKKAFLEQVERYNQQFDAQADDDYGKEAYRLSAIRTAPFYGLWFGGTLLTTIDGLRINSECQVLDEKGAAIEGFYAAGDVSGSFFSGNYPEYIVGVASGRSSTQGRHVARKLGGDL